METNNGVEAVYAPTRLQWRKWLQKHSRTKEEVCLILYHKRSLTRCVSYNDAVEEALCFGWIDSKTNKRDPESYYQRFSPRKPGSSWSASNRERVQRLTEAGKMTPQGLQVVELAKQTGRWDPGAHTV